MQRQPLYCRLDAVKPFLGFLFLADEFLNLTLEGIIVGKPFQVFFDLLHLLVPLLFQRFESGDLVVESYTGSYENIMGLPVEPLKAWGLV